MMEGFLNILKPPGMSSHDVVNAVRKILQARRVGHAGTLDPAAAGVLPVAVGRAARFIEYLSMSDKSYRAEILLGAETDSGDLMGRITRQRTDFSMPSMEELRGALEEFRGKIMQRPSVFSAIKVKGRKACDLARREESVEIPARQVEIYRIALLEACPEERKFLMDVDCSKGTYIRSLCMDIGNRLGIPSVLSFLLRTRVGGFCLPQACTLEELSEQKEGALLAVGDCLSHIPAYELPEHRVKPFCNGLPTGVHEKELPALLRVCSAGEFLGIARYDSKEQSVCPVKIYRECT